MSVYCPLCNGEGEYTGTLGNLDWFRCRQCGMDFYRSVNNREEVENPEDEDE